MNPPEIVERLRRVKSADEFCRLVDGASKAERAEIRRELLEWQTIATESAQFHRRGAMVAVVAIVAGAVGFLAVAAQVLAIVCR